MRRKIFCLFDAKVVQKLKVSQQSIEIATPAHRFVSFGAGGIN